MVNKQTLTHALNSDGRALCQNTPAVKAELATTLSETDVLISGHSNKEAIPFIFWNDFFNKKGTFAPKSHTHQIRYRWGDKIFVDFGCSNIQTELSYPHPAVVLYNFANTVIVAPTTSNDSTTGFSKDVENIIIKVKCDGAIFPKDTIINLHQIKSIHKDRILKNLKQNISQYVVDDAEIHRLNSAYSSPVFIKGMDLLTCIRIRLIMMFAAAEIDKREKELERRNSEIESLKQFITQQQEKNDNISKEMSTRIQEEQNP